MVSKVISAACLFYNTCRYVCRDESRARVLDAEGVRTHDYKLMAADFELQREMRPGKGKAVFHSVLSYSPGEQPDDAQMVEIARKYLDRIGMANTQFVITRHTDKAHAHMHIIANRVDNSGKSIDDSWIGLRAKKAAQKLTEEYGLAQSTRKNLKLTHRENLNESEAIRCKIYEEISKILPQCESFEQLEKRLGKKGIDVKYRYGKEDAQGEKQLQGISFRLGKACFKGSQVDREFSIKNLQETLEQRRLAQEERQQPRQSLGMGLRL